MSAPMDFKAALREVLPEGGRPLHYGDITDLSLDFGYLASSGRTPHNTNGARLSVAVRDNPETPGAVRTAPGVYGLEETN
jgi:hypothetical protein